MAHVSSEHHCAASSSSGRTPLDESAVCRPRENLSGCSPLNLTGPRPRSPPSASHLAVESRSNATAPGSSDTSHHDQRQHDHHQHHRDGHQELLHPAERAEGPPPAADRQLPPCATIRLAESPAPAQHLPQPLAPVQAATFPPVPPHHSSSPHHQSQQQLPAPPQHQPQQPAAPQDSSPFRCSSCDQGFDSKRALLAHREEHNAGKLYICDICGIGLSKKSSVQRHLMTHMGTRKFPCDECPRSFYQRHDMLRHKALHSKEPVQCDGCSRQFSARHYMAAHRCSAVPRPDRRRRKRGGPNSGPSPAATDRLAARETDSEQLACRLCGRTCSTQAAWGFHMWRHTKDAKYLPTGGVGVLPAPPKLPPAPEVVDIQ